MSAILWEAVVSPCRGECLRECLLHWQTDDVFGLNEMGGCWNPERPFSPHGGKLGSTATDRTPTG